MTSPSINLDQIFEPERKRTKTREIKEMRATKLQSIIRCPSQRQSYCIESSFPSPHLISLLMRSNFSRLQLLIPNKNCNYLKRPLVYRLIPKFSLLSANLYRPMKIGMDVLLGP